MFLLVAAAATFDLICSGQQVSTDMTGRHSEPYRTEYRIDLDAKKWCDGACTGLRDFASITPTELRLVDNNTDTPHMRSFFTDIIDRRTGTHTVLSSSGAGMATVLMESHGTCERAPFTGFPKPVTKF